MIRSRSTLISIVLIVLAIVLVVATVFIAQQIAARQNVNPDDTNAAVRGITATKVKDLPTRRTGKLDVMGPSNILVAAVAGDTALNGSGLSYFNGTNWSNTVTMGECDNVAAGDFKRNPERVLSHIVHLNNSEVALGGWARGVIGAINITNGSCRPVDNRTSLWGGQYDNAYPIGTYTFPDTGATVLYSTVANRENDQPGRFFPINVANRSSGVAASGQIVDESAAGVSGSFGPGVAIGGGKFFVSFNTTDTGNSFIVGPVIDRTSSAVAANAPMIPVNGEPNALVVEAEMSTAGPSTVWAVGYVSATVSHVYGVDPANGNVRTAYQFPQTAGITGRASNVLQIGNKLLVGFGIGNDDTANVRGGISVCNLSAANVISGCSAVLAVPGADMILDTAFYRNKIYALGGIGNAAGVFEIALQEDIPTVTATATATATASPTATATATITTTPSGTAGPTCSNMYLNTNTATKTIVLNAAQSVDVTMLVNNAGGTGNGTVGVYNKSHTTNSIPQPALLPITAATGMSSMTNSNGITVFNGLAAPTKVGTVSTYKWKISYDQLRKADSNFNNAILISAQLNGFAGGTSSNPNCVVTVNLSVAAASPTPTGTATATPSQTATPTTQASPTATTTVTTTVTGTSTVTATSTITSTSTTTPTDSSLPNTAISIEVWGYLIAIGFFGIASGIFVWDLRNQKKRGR
jgi:hypothetical protein